MADHALVVGCDAYPNLPGGNLRGAVADALAVREWLLSRDGGAVGAREVTLLVSCSAQGAQAGPAVVTGPATRTAFAQAVGDLVAMPDARESDRLFVYLAGHGCRTDPQNPVIAQDAFAFTDFAAIDPAAACAGVQDLVSRLRMSRFGTIVIFLDACRNFPFLETFDLGRIGRDPKPPAGRLYEPRVFLMHSTLPGRTSRGRPDQADGRTWRGDFTVALIDGLRGAGTAKAYDEKLERPYTVRWSTLASYVEAAVPEQSPRGPGEGDVVLASFPDGYFDPVTLTVKVHPGQFASAEGLRVRVRYTDPSAADDPEEQKPGPAPVDFCVPPAASVFTPWQGMPGAGSSSTCTPTMRWWCPSPPAGRPR